jgi:dienelactone hydrolase
MLASLLFLLAAEPTLAERVARFTPALSPKEAVAQESARLREALQAGNRESSAAWKNLTTRDDWDRFRLTLTRRLMRSLGETAPQVRPTVQNRGTLEGDGFRVQRLTFEATPGLTITVNLYEPKPLRKKMPALLLVHSHHSPKSEGELQDIGQMAARAGCVTLVPDLLGHGERRLHPFAKADDFPKPFRVGRQDYYFRFPAAVQLQTRGESLMTLMVRDLRQCINVLNMRGDIDPDRIAILGAVAGGGDPAALTAAVEPRITTAVIFNFGGPQPETRYPLPDDAETTFNYAGGGSWESTRNLTGSVSDGFLPWAIVGSIAPRRLVYAHEFRWDRERDPVWKRLQTIWKWHDAEKNLRFTHGTGSLSGKSPEASHCNNMGRVHRVGIRAALKEWWEVDLVEADKPTRFTAAELRCLKDGERAGTLRDLLPPKPTLGTRAALWTNWRERLRLNEKERPQKLVWTAIKDAPVANTFTATLAEREGAGVTLFLPRGVKQPPLTVLFGQGGTATLLPLRAKEIARLLEAGEAVAVVDLGGTAQMPPGSDRQRTSSATSLASTALMLDRPLLGRRFTTLHGILAALRQRAELKDSTVKLWGDSPVPAQPKAEVMPLDTALPPHAEPLGAHLALLLALADPTIAEVRCTGGMARWTSLSAQAAVYLPYDAVVPGAISAGDWPAVVAVLDDRKVHLERLVDGLNRPVPLAEAKRLFGGGHVTIGE